MYRQADPASHQLSTKPMEVEMKTIDKWRRCESCFTTEITCTGMHRDNKYYCCSDCAHPSRDGDD